MEDNPTPHPRPVAFNLTFGDVRRIWMSVLPVVPLSTLYRYGYYPVQQNISPHQQRVPHRPRISHSHEILAMTPILQACNHYLPTDRE